MNNNDDNKTTLSFDFPYWLSNLSSLVLQISGKNNL